MFGIGSQEIIIILAIAFFIFGAKRLPELGKSLGQGIRGFKTAMTERPQIEAPHNVPSHPSPPAGEGRGEGDQPERR
jgi:sec-independent protein translocase protein TatA